VHVRYRREQRRGPGHLSERPGPAVFAARISEEGFEDAIDQAIARATKTLRGVEGAWVKDQNVMIEDGNIVGYKVNLEVTFVLEDGA
jgi:flavin-binding protein dodecin